MSVAECQQKVSSAEFTEWLAFENIDPGEPGRSDAQTALLCLHIYNMLSDKKAPRRKLTDFLLKFDNEEITISPEEKIKRSKSFWRSISGKK